MPTIIGIVIGNPVNPDDVVPLNVMVKLETWPMAHPLDKENVKGVELLAVELAVNDELKDSVAFPMVTHESEEANVPLTVVAV
jgi:hypothetical protein